MRLSILYKLVGPLLIGGVALLVILSVVSVRLGTRLLVEQQTVALDGLRASRQAYIEKYFKIIRAQMATSSQNRMIGQAVTELSAAFTALLNSMPCLMSCLDGSTRR